jgi:hypothetical protein
MYGTIEKGVGIDYLYRVGRFGLGGGIGYDFKEGQGEAQAEASYNIERLTGVTHNTSVFLGHDLKKWVGGVRIAL